jgi:hypothetical protein
LAVLEMEALPVLMDALEAWWKGYQHEETKVMAAMTASVTAAAAAVNIHMHGHQQQGPPTVTSTAIQAARQNRCRTVAELLAALRAEHARVVQAGGASPSPLPLPFLSASATSSSALEPTTAVSSIVDKPQSQSPAAPRLRLKLSSSITAAAAASGLMSTTTTEPTSTPTTSNNSTSPQQQQHKSEMSSPFHIHISQHSSQPHAAPPAPAVVRRKST